MASVVIVDEENLTDDFQIDLSAVINLIGNFNKG